MNPLKRELSSLANSDNPADRLAAVQHPEAHLGLLIVLSKDSNENVAATAYVRIRRIVPQLKAGEPKFITLARADSLHIATIMERKRNGLFKAAGTSPHAQVH